jgi:uncharacterized membrane protein YraQ (UPF0718 family)
MPLKVEKLFFPPQGRDVFTCTMAIRNYRVFFFRIILAVLIFISAGCADRRIEDAFQGKFTSAENNKVINEYCKSCHIHKTFDPADHMSSIRSYYKSPYFKRTHECRACHYIEKNWVTNNYHRKTRNPKKANRGAFRDFEHAEIKQLKKNRKQKH